MKLLKTKHLRHVRVKEKRMAIDRYTLCIINQTSIFFFLLKNGVYGNKGKGVEEICNARKTRIVYHYKARVCAAGNDVIRMDCFPLNLNFANNNKDAIALYR